MIKFSKNKKMNNVLNNIYTDLKELGVPEIKRYYNEFKHYADFNIAEYGNLLIYYEDVRKLYKDYKSLQNASNNKIWNIYKRQVGYVARFIVKKEGV